MYFKLTIGHARTDMNTVHRQNLRTEFKLSSKLNQIGADS